MLPRRLRSIAALVAVTATKSTHQQRPQQAVRCLSTTATRSSSVDLVAAGVAVLQAADPMHKVELTRHLAQQLQVDRGGCNAGDSGVTSPQLATTTLLPSPDYRQWKAVAARIPQQPARPAEPRLVEPKAMKRPRGVPLAVYLLHSVAHIELNAIGTHSVTACSWCCSCVCILKHLVTTQADVFWDTLVRFYNGVAPESQVAIQLLQNWGVLMIPSHAHSVSAVLYAPPVLCRYLGSDTG